MRRTQIKIGETIGVVFVVYLIMIFGIIWYGHSAEESKRDFVEERALANSYNTYNYIVNHPLLQKKTGGNPENSHELSLVNLKSFKNHTSQFPGYYKGKLGDSIIKIQIYNYTSSGHINKKENILIYNSTKNISQKSIKTFFNLMNVYYPEEKNTYIGLLVVKVPY